MLRWAILSMWATGALGLAFFGISDKPLDPNQTHLLFAPVMAAYGVAFVSILWTRLEFVNQIPMLRNAHLIVICGLCAMPLVLDMPRQAKLGLSKRDWGGVPHWPPYYAPVLHSDETGLRNLVKEDEVVFSDQPWAVAWYADRISIWLPPTKDDFVRLENAAIETDTPPAGILITPSSHGDTSVKEAIDLYRDFAPLVLNGGVLKATTPSPVAIHDKSPKIIEVTSNYPYIKYMLGAEIIFYSGRQ